MPRSVTPLTARTQVDRDLVALLFWVSCATDRRGRRPTSREGWSVNEAGTAWTVDLREDARWHVPVSP